MRGISKAALAGVIVVVVVIVAVAAYFLMAPPAVTPTPTPSPTPTPTPTPTPAPRTLVIGVTDKVTDLDPSNAYDFFTWEVLYNVMAGLVKYKPGTAELELDLAESYEVKDGGKTWVFKLKKDLKFADGTPLTAKDFVRSIERVKRINGDPAWLVTDFVESVEAPDDYTVVFKLSAPVAYFLALAATPPYFPVHPKYAPDKIDSDQTAGGAGPYRIVRFVRDQEIVLEANPYYHGPKPYYDRIVIKFFKDATTMRLALEAGEIDVAWRTLRPVDIRDLRAIGRFNVIEIPGSFIRYIIVNTVMVPDARVRQALSAATCRSELSEKVFMGTMDVLYSLVPKGMWSHVPVFKDLDCNVELAKRLLREAGYSKANKLKVELWYTPTHYGDTEKDLAALLKEQWEKTGLVEVTIKSAEWSTYVDNARKGVMMFSLFGWYPDYIDPDDFLTPFLKPPANKWTGSGYSNDRVNELLTKAQLVTDIGERTKLYEQVQQILREDAPIIPLLQGRLYMVTKPGISVVVGPTMIVPYNLIKGG